MATETNVTRTNPTQPNPTDANVSNDIRAEELLGAAGGVSSGVDDIEEEEVVIGEGVKLPLKVRFFFMNNVKYFAYFVPVVVLGKEMECELRPRNNTKNDSDKNGYSILTAIFDAIEKETGKREYVLCCQKKARRDDLGKRTSSISYEVVYKDSTSGMTFSVGMVPYGDSNKRLLESMFAAKLSSL